MSMIAGSIRWTVACYRRLIEKFGGGPVGVDTLAVALSEDVDTLTDVYEPFLIQCGFLARTPRGRIATEHAYRHLKLAVPSQP